MINDFPDSFKKKMYQWAIDLFPLNRSITGEANRKTLEYLKEILPKLEMKHFKSGDKVFDWEIPQEYYVEEAYIEDKFGNIIIDFKNNNLHLASYSISVDKYMNLTDLNKHLYSLSDLPNAIPYKTFYYKRDWAFCITHNQRKELKDELYHIVIKSRHFDGQLDYGQLILPGKTKKEILLSTYICHPSMANNEISGIVVTTALAKFLSTIPDTEYTYRVLFIPETIGSIAYLSKNLIYLQENVIAGFVITCVGDDLEYSFMPSRNGNTIADKAALYALSNYVTKYIKYSFLDRGSDERQYCSPLINLPVVSIMRTKYGMYKEYHTSLDDLSFISENGLYGAASIIYKTILILEYNFTYSPLIPCEPQLGKRNLYNISSNDNSDELINVLAYVDGETDLIDIAKIINADFFKCHDIIKILLKNDLLKQL
jgi:aminopeptidase-like protein